MARKKISREKTSSIRASSKSLSPKELSEKIQRKAYELYEKRGYAYGDDWADWFKAEKIVKRGK